MRCDGGYTVLRTALNSRVAVVLFARCADRSILISLGESLLCREVCLLFILYQPRGRDYYAQSSLEWRRPRKRVDLRYGIDILALGNDRNTSLIWARFTALGAAAYSGDQR